MDQIEESVDVSVIEEHFFTPSEGKFISQEHWKMVYTFRNHIRLIFPSFYYTYTSVILPNQDCLNFKITWRKSSCRSNLISLFYYQGERAASSVNMSPCASQVQNEKCRSTISSSTLVSLLWLLTYTFLKLEQSA